MTTYSLNVDSNHRNFAHIANPSANSSFLYPLRDFAFQVWVKTNSSGVIASNQYRPPTSNNVCTDNSSYGYWSVHVNTDGTLQFDLSYYKYMPQNPQTHATTPQNFPFYAFNCTLRSHAEFSDGKGHKARINDNHWHRVEAVREGYHLRLFVDGVLIASQSYEDVFSAGPVPFTVVDGGKTVMVRAPALTPSNVNSTAAPLYIGWDAYLSNNNTQNNHFSGSIDEARLWGKAMSRTSLTQMANLIPPADDPALLGRWGFDSDSASAPLDATGRNGSCTWYPGSPSFGSAGFVPPTPQYLSLSGSGSGVSFGDGTPYEFSGDFSVQAWVRPDPGQVGALVSRQSNSGGWTVLVESDGSVTFYMRSSSHQYTVSSPPAAMYDGNWHHVAAVRQGIKIQLYVDGRPAGDQTYTSIDPMSMSVGGLFLGTNTYTGNYANRSTSYSRHISGGYDEVRLWSRALTQAENTAGMFHAADATDTSLVGYWQFDVGDLTDSSLSRNSHHSATGASYSPAPFDFTPIGQPYLLTQACLMQEYIEANSLHAETTTYRVVINARGNHDGARPTTLKLWSETPVAIQYGKESATLTATTPVEARTNGQGVFVFTLRAKISDSGNNSQDKLYCPGIYIRADFMSEGEQIFVSPDRQMHAKLSTIDGASLKSGVNGGPALLDSTFSSDDAAAIAGAMNDIMTTAAHHNVRATSTIDTSSMKAVRARDASALQSGLPTQPLYLSRSTQALSANQANHLVRSHYLPAAVGVERTTVSGYRRSVATQFNYSSRAFSAITSGDVQTRTAGCVTTSVAKSTGSVTARSMSSLWDDFVDGALHVVDSIVETVEDAASSLTATIVHLVNGAEQAFQYAIATVEDAADYLKGMLVSLGLAVTRVVDFCRTIFSWEQYGPAYSMLMTYTDQMYRSFQAGLTGINALIDERLMGWKSQVDTAMDSFLQNTDVASMTLQAGGGQALVQPPGDVQSNYLGSVLTDHIDSYSSARPTGGITPTVYSAPDVSNNDQFMAFMEKLLDGRGLLSLGLDELVRGVKSLLDWVFNTAKSMVDGLFTSVEGMLGSVWAILDGELPHIPILTNLFLLELNVAWTPRSLFCMMGAVAANLAYKVAMNDVTASLATLEMADDARDGDVFYNAAMQLYATLGIPVTSAAKRGQPVGTILFDVASYCLGGLYTVSTVVWGVAAVATDLSNYQSLVPRGLRELNAELEDFDKSPELQPVNPLAGLRVGASIFANLSAFPLMVFNTPFSDARAGSELALWCVYAGAMVSDIIAWKANPDAGTIGAKVASLAAGAAGALALAGAIVVAVADFILAGDYSAKTIAPLVLKVVQNVLGSMTLLSQLCFLVPPTPPYGAAINFAPVPIDAVAYFGNALLSGARLITDASLKVADAVR